MSNLKEIDSFFQAKKSYIKIDNTERLLNLIKIYFETVLFYQKNTVRIKGIEYHIEINVTHENGEKKVLDILDISIIIL